MIGYKTRLSAVTLFVLLMIENLTLNDFFMHDPDDHMHDYKKFNFFQVRTCGTSVWTKPNSWHLAFT